MHYGDVTKRHPQQPREKKKPWMKMMKDLSYSDSGHLLTRYQKLMWLKYLFYLMTLNVAV